MEKVAMADEQIILIPRQGSWAWVRAARDYALAFGPNLTPDPDSAGKYRFPNQTVTVALAPDAYPVQGDIVLWFRTHYPQVRLDVVKAETPEAFKAYLAKRIAARDRYAQPDQPFRLYWPTDYLLITQPYGVHPEIYTRFGLPGHEGLDIRAPHGSPVYAAADGEVYQVHDNPKDHAYGKHVRIRHRDGYRTIYAHLARILVREGQPVSARQLIGEADSTGNSTGSHLHITLKKDGATAAGLTRFPKDILDPTPFLVWQSTADAISTSQPCRVGVNCLDGLQEADLTALKQAKVEAVKFPQTLSNRDLQALRQTLPEVFTVCRLSLEMSREAVPPEAFVTAVQSDLARLYGLGVRDFEIHHEPNTQACGWGRSWRTGGDFGDWFRQVLGSVRKLAPEARFGFPGLMPGEGVEGQREDADLFLDGADDAALSADWVGVNCFWSSRAEMIAPEKGRSFEQYRRRFPQSVLMITECANVNEKADYPLRGSELVEYYRDLRGRAGISAAFANILSAPSGCGKQVWRLNDGTSTAVVTALNQRKA
jgi:hypothetical protein